jgi:hypothetical protein
MYDAQGSYRQGDEIRGLNINLENPETEFNGHRRRMEPVELMKCLQREVQIYTEANES